MSDTRPVGHFPLPDRSAILTELTDVRIRSVATIIDRRRESSNMRGNAVSCVPQGYCGSTHSSTCPRGFLLATFPRSIVEPLGTATDVTSWPSILSVTLIGSGVALMIEYLGKPTGMVCDRLTPADSGRGRVKLPCRFHPQTRYYCLVGDCWKGYARWRAVLQRY